MNITLNDTTVGALWTALPPLIDCGKLRWQPANPSGTLTRREILPSLLSWRFGRFMLGRPERYSPNL